MNDSVKYLLVTAFDYEIKNKIEVRISEINKNKDEDLPEIVSDELKLLLEVKEYLKKRMVEMKV
jgi:hypothetical protein